MIMDKKVTIKYFLNKDLSPAVYYTEEGRINLFPLYIRVTYNRESTRFKFSPSIHIEENTDIDQFFIDRKIEYISDDKKEIIERLVRYEVEKFGKKFTLRGLGNRLIFYEQGVSNFMLNTENENEKLNKVIEKSSYNNLLPAHLLNDLSVRLSIAATLLGKEKFNETYPNLIKKYILSGFIYNTHKRTINIFDWVIKNVKLDVLQYIKSNKAIKKQQGFMATSDMLIKHTEEKYRDLVMEIQGKSGLEILSNAINNLRGNIHIEIDLEELTESLDKEIKIELNQLQSKMFK